MGYENRTFQSTTANTPPTGTDPLVDNTALGDVQAIKLLDPTAGSTDPLIGQKARAGSMPTALSTEDAALLADLLTNTAFQARIPTNGQKAMAASLPVVVASDQSAIPVSASSLPLPSGAATEATLANVATAANQSTLNTRIGDVTETAPATDTASSGLNGRLQRIAQRLSSLIALIPAALTSAGGFKVSLLEQVGTDTTLQNAVSATGNGATLDVSGVGTIAIQIIGTFSATITFEANIDGTNWVSILGVSAQTGSAATSTTGMGMFRFSVAGYKQFRARVTWTSGTSVTVIAHTLPDSAPALVSPNVTQSGTWTVQPGNTQNTTPWLASPIATTIDVTVTRPNDTTAYAANDELSDSTSAPAVITVTGAARASGGSVRLISARLIDSSNQATKPQLLIFLFDTTTTPGNDNSAFAPSDSVMNTCVGVLPFNIWYPGDDTSGATGNAVSPYMGPVLNIKTSGSANLFARIKVLNAYTPTAQEAFKLRLDFMQD